MTCHSKYCVVKLASNAYFYIDDHKAIDLDDGNFYSTM